MGGCVEEDVSAALRKGVVFQSLMLFVLTKVNLFETVASYSSNVEF